MNLFTSADGDMYRLQCTWNELNPAEAIMYDQYELADITKIDSSEWSAFLRDGKVVKYIDKEVQLFKEAQMRKLIGRATTNDKSVGTAQMLNAIGKTLEDESVETNFFIYSHVPLTANECEADLVTQDTRWHPPVDIKEIGEEQVTLEKPNVPDEGVNKEQEVNDDDWF